ncbi:hypothetical protein Hdeb2414_s0008g00280841 [Helianthus debilis subsp. tardiflorus]
MYNSASGSRAPKSGKSTRKVDISKITPPASPLSKPLDLSPPHPDIRGKEKEDEVKQVKNVAKDVVAGVGEGEAFVEGAETEKKRHRLDLLDDHIHAGINFYATCQEVVREWQLMGEDTLEFETAKKELAEEREQFNAGRKGLLWRVSDAEEKLAKEKQLNANKQKEWETACERTNREMQAARDQIVKLKGEKTQISNEQE